MRHISRINNTVVPALDSIKVGTHRTRDLYSALYKKKVVLGQDYSAQTLVSVLTNLPDWKHNGVIGAGSRWVKFELAPTQVEVSPEPKAEAEADAFTVELEAAIARLRQDMISVFDRRFGVKS